MQLRSLYALVLIALNSDAFSPMSSTVARSSKFALQASDKPLTELCEITKEACDVVSPLLRGELFM